MSGVDENGEKDRAIPPAEGDVVETRKQGDGKHPEQEAAEREEKAAGSGENAVPAEEAPDFETIESPPAEKPAPEAVDPPPFPVIGIGASAGGLEALEAFAAALPEESGMAFVVIAHTHPEHVTMLPALLERKSKAAVVLLENGMRLEPNTIYIPPSHLDAVMENRVVRLRQRMRRLDVHMPIDVFLKSLAENYGEAAGCVILSGTGTDGTGGLRRIKEEAGVAVAQTQESARHSGMPMSAISTGLIDYILDPAEIPEKLIDYFQHPATLRASSADLEEDQDSAEIVKRIIGFLAERTRHDFSMYKKSTLVRRIERRMSVTRCRTASDYFRYLHRKPEEVKALFQDLLIGVTNFFRDPEVFEFMRKKVIPELLLRTSKGDSLRVWIPGCATGEEAYSVAILLNECMEAHQMNRDVQIFATDIDPTAIEKARQGVYPENIGVDVSPERLRRYFSKEDMHYRVKKEIREPVVFAEQNILRDPPFMHLDLLVCRNLLIYLEPRAQGKLLPLFHYNLKAGGILFLGTSESTGRHADLFEPVNKKFSIYRKKDIGPHRQPYVHFPVGEQKLRHPAPSIPDIPEAEIEPPPEIGIDRVVERKLLHEHTPACVIVNRNHEVVYIHGRTGKYLEHAQGKPSTKVIELAREGLRYGMSAALRRAGEKNEPIREYGLRVKTNGDFVTVDLVVEPLREPLLKDHFMILIREVEAREGGYVPKGDGSTVAADRDEGSRIVELERELQNLRQDYRSTVEELETSNEELKSANEELYSSNEELQSTNEELESSREELESLNEELSTVNSELHDKISEVQEAYSKITEVLNSTGIAIVFLDNDMVVKRFTHEATRLINLIEKDVGRPIDHISHNLEYSQFTDKIREVIHGLSPVEEDVRTHDGHWYRMRIMVHRTEKNTIEGAVLTFISITGGKGGRQLDRKA